MQKAAGGLHVAGQDVIHRQRTVVRPVGGGRHSSTQKGRYKALAADKNMEVTLQKRFAKILSIQTPAFFYSQLTSFRTVAQHRDIKRQVLKRYLYKDPKKLRSNNKYSYLHTLVDLNP
jgi:hypothetical protein